VAETGGGVPQVEAASEQLASGVVPTALDVEIHRGCISGGGDLVRHPVRVPWPGAPDALAAAMTWAIALTALVTLGLSGDPVHEPVHAGEKQTHRCNRAR
jgi:hypothetical protein